MNSSLKNMILAALFAALTAIGAFIQVPLGFTSITLQVFFTLMAAVLLGAKWGTLSQLVYVLLGIFGLPIFTKGGGFSYFLQPSMGFLIGLIPMAFVVGLFVNNIFKKKNVLCVLVALIVGEIILYIIGLPYMWMILNVYLENSYSFMEIFSFGCLVYLPGDLVKIIAVLLLYKPILKALNSANLK